MPASEAFRLQQIARVLKSNGADGELVWGFRDLGPQEINVEEPVFIEYDGLPVPFFIESLTPRGVGKALVRLSDIRTFEDAEEIVGKSVCVPADHYPKSDGNDPETLVGWTLLHSDGRMAGVITGFEDIPGNPCLCVECPGGNTVLIPLHEDLVRDAAPEQEILTMDLPEGLF